MRRVNAIVTAGMLLCFILHAVFGSLQLFGASGSTVTRILGTITFSFCAAHVAIGIYLTAVSVYAGKKSGKFYFKDNMLFWARRISGLPIIAAIVFHVVALNIGSAPKLAMQILLGVSIAFHVVLNVKPVLITLGIKPLKQHLAGISLAFSVLILLTVIAFIVYYVRWYVW